VPKNLENIFFLLYILVVGSGRSERLESTWSQKLATKNRHGLNPA